MSSASPKKRNAYLEKIQENLLSLFRMIDKFDQNLLELSQLANGSTTHIADIERILGTDDDEDDENESESTVDPRKELIAGEKLCQLNDALNVSIREIRQSWNSLEKQSAAMIKLLQQSPKMIRLFLDTTKNDSDFNDPSFRAEMTELSEQYPMLGQFYYELSLEIQVLFLDLSHWKGLKDLATHLELLSSRSLAIAVPLQIIRQIQMKLI